MFVKTPITSAVRSVNPVVGVNVDISMQMRDGVKCFVTFIEVLKAVGTVMTAQAALFSSKCSVEYKGLAPVRASLCLNLFTVERKVDGEGSAFTHLTITVDQPAVSFNDAAAYF